MRTKKMARMPKHMLTIFSQNGDPLLIMEMNPVNMPKPITTSNLMHSVLNLIRSLTCSIHFSRQVICPAVSCNDEKTVLDSIFAVSKRSSLKYIPALLVILFSYVQTSQAQSLPDSVPSQAAVPTDSLRTVQLQRDSLRRAERQKELFRRAQQEKDSLLKISQAAILRAADSLQIVQQQVRRRQLWAGTQDLLARHPYYHFDGLGQSLPMQQRTVTSRNGIFYFVVSLVMYLALMRLIFYKYMNTMFTLFFRATMRQQQLREQLLQAPLPALLMNIFFLVSAATYCTLLGQHYAFAFAANFWHALAYGVILFGAIYVGKYILLNIVGWIFGISHVADTYLFVVFLINKMLGIFLLPAIVLLAFPLYWLVPIVITLSYVLIAGMLLYRFAISYRPIRTEIKLTRLHFFLYLCAFEIAPLLLIYKVLLASLNSSS